MFTKPLADVAPTAPAPDGAAAIVDPGQRAPVGWKRYRLRNATSGQAVTRYIVARNAADAEALFRQEQGVVTALALTELPD